jgi:hypothetical protein
MQRQLPHSVRSLVWYFEVFCAGAFKISRRLGIIKGSEKSLEFPNRVLDRDTYESLRVSNGNYALFEAYQTLKRKRNERDLADRCAFSVAHSTRD